MTMPYSPSRAVYEGNDAATRFPFSFKVWDATQLVVTLTSPDGVTTEPSGWTVELGASGGEIVYLHDNAPLPAGWKLAVTRDMPFTQEVNLVSASRFDPQVIEDALDQATAERQQVKEMLWRAVILPATSEETPQDVVQAVYAARDGAMAAASSASGSQSAAAASAGAAADSAATAAQTVTTAAATAVTAATAQADRAEEEADRAQAAADTAANDASAAIEYVINRATDEAGRAGFEADLARRWASEDEGVTVAGDYSARHYAAKAKEAIPENLVQRVTDVEAAASAAQSTATTAQSTANAAKAVTDTATPTPTANAVPRADVNGKLDEWVSLAGKANKDLGNVTGNAIKLFFHAYDAKPSGTQGGTSGASAWQTRDLNTVAENTIDAVLTANRFTLQPGTYRIVASAPGFRCNQFRAALYNYTSGQYVLYGTSECSASAGSDTARSFVNGTFTVSTATTFELRMFSQLSYGVVGLGEAVSAGMAEKYSEVQIWKV